MAEIDDLFGDRADAVEVLDHLAQHLGEFVLLSGEVGRKHGAAMGRQTEEFIVENPARLYNARSNLMEALPDEVDLCRGHDRTNDENIASMLRKANLARHENISPLFSSLWHNLMMNPK